MKKTLLSVALAVALAAVAGIASTGVSAQEDPDTWSIAVHLRYGRYQLRHRAEDRDSDVGRGRDAPGLRPGSLDRVGGPLLLLSDR